MLRRPIAGSDARNLIRMSKKLDADWTDIEILAFRVSLKRSVNGHWTWRLPEQGSGPSIEGDLTEKRKVAGDRNFAYCLRPNM